MRHPDPTKPVAQPIRYLWERHHEIARRVVAGERPKDIAADMAITEPRLSVILNSPLMRERIEYLRDQADGLTIDIRRRLSWLAQQSMDVLEKAIEQKTEDGGLSLLQKVRVGQDVLDRAGHGKVTITRGEHAHLHMTSDDLREMKDRVNGKSTDGNGRRKLYGRDAGMSPAGKVVDVEPEPEPEPESGSRKPPNGGGDKSA